MSRLDELKNAIETGTARIGVIGLGYVGLPLGVEFAKAGFDVTGFDLDAQKVRKLEAGESYIEDVPAADLQAVKEAGRFRATTNFAALTKLDVINICVPTPLTRAKDPDVSHMAAAMDEIRKRLRAGQLIILGSTTYPGTTTELFVPALEETGLSVGKDFALCFAPERIDPGNERFKVRNVPKVVGGETPACTELGCAVFSKIFETVVPVSSSRCAEMVKLLENTFRAINIGLANEVALMCERLGLDVWEVIEAAATKPYGFMKFLPGPGLGGHCIPVDPSYLSWKLKSLDFSARFIELATDINSAMPEHVADRCGALLNEQRLAVNGSKILILGVAYKKDVGDMRESPALDVVSLLASRGADIRFHDPHVGEFEVDGHGYKGSELTDAAIEDADLVVILTDHGDVDYARVVKHAGRVFDTRNATRDVREGREKITKL
ncbi:MAG: nucleotide sugar dehydrogenase [Myxococcota bacterium]|nr:nucleotide sugar dehydrogenase [Myxococcales bacterium]